MEQFDDMIRHNSNPMNNNFWYLFTQLIFQLAQIHKKTNTAITEWEWHFNKLQHGLTFDENNPDVFDISENENCDKKLTQNDAGSSQDKLYDKHKIHSLDECAKNMMEGLRAIPRHLNINKGKMLDIQPESQKFPHETINNTETAKTEPQVECHSFCLCSHENVWDSEKKMSLNWQCGKNATIAKDIMNYI